MLLALSPHTSQVLVGTRGGEIFEFDVIDGKSPGPLIQSSNRSHECAVARHGCLRAMRSGHYNGALLGLAVHPSKNEFATVGDDKVLRIYNTTSMKVVHVSAPFPPSQARCVRVHHTDKSCGR
jgi:WD40 repeat protein